MKSFRSRLTLILVSLIGCSMLVAGLFVAKLLDDSHKQELRNHMVREAKLILSQMDWEQQVQPGGLGVALQELAHRVKDATGNRVTFIDQDGTVLGDSESDPAVMENHLDRPEVEQAKREGIGYSIRYSESTGEPMLYVAVAAESEGASAAAGYIRLAASLADVEQSLRQLWVFLLIGLFVLFAIAGLISYQVAYGLTRPIEKMTRVARKISNMDYNARVVIRNKDEIGELGHAINSMAESLQRQMQRIQEHEKRLTIVLDNMISGVMMMDRNGRIAVVNRAAEEILGISAQELLGNPFEQMKQQLGFSPLIEQCLETGEHVRDEVTLHFPNEAIVEVNVTPISQSEEDWEGVLVVLHNITNIRKLERMRSEFVANVSHELKTPVASVKGFAETLLNGAIRDEETARSFVQIIYDESERLNRLIGDILELSKIESRRATLVFSPVHVRSFLDRCVHMMASEAAKKHIGITVSAPDDLYLEADEDRLQQIIINLLSNSINYTQEHGRVRLEARRLEDGEDTEEEKIRITVSDTGIGIPKKDLPRIFERFYRVDKARSRSSGGTGLGLSIVKHLVELHHGSISVESEYGVGTTFTIDLPVIQL